MTDAVRLGFLDDTPRGVENALLERALGLALDRVRRTNRLDANVSFHVVRAEGLPRGTAADIERAFAVLAATDVLAVLGPAIGDNALVATPLADQHALPTLNFAGTERARSEHMFHLQIGSHEEEPVLLAQQLKRAGHEEVAVLFEEATIGARYAEFFDEACVSADLRLGCRIGLPPGADPAEATRRAVGAGSDALVYLGLGVALPQVSGAVREVGFDGLLACNSCGMFGWAGPPYDAGLEGWHYIDVFSEDNPAYATTRTALSLAENAAPTALIYADLTTLAVEGLANAPELTRAGLRIGLERVKALPSSLGLPGTQLGFGTWDRAALKGPYLVPRLWRDARSVPWL